MKLFLLFDQILFSNCPEGIGKSWTLQLSLTPVRIKPLAIFIIVKSALKDGRKRKKRP